MKQRYRSRSRDKRPDWTGLILTISGFIKLKSDFFVQIDTPIGAPYYEGEMGE
jgi:hypothetical protein